MRILIFGATGGTGRYVVSQGLAAGHTLTAFVRNPAALQMENKQLGIVQGNILDKEKVSEAIKGQDVIISVLGNSTSQAIRNPSTTISKGLANIIAGMKKHGVRRLLFVTSFGVSSTLFLPEKLFITIFLKNLFADIPTQERLIKESNLDWTIVRPARLTNKPWTGNYKAGEDVFIHPFSSISRADVADFLLKNIQTPTSIRKTILLSYR